MTLSRDQARRLDRWAIGTLGLPGIVLMENAGRACAEEAADMLGAVRGRRVLAVCGKGNNGGDGLVIARHLCNRGAEVTVLFAADIEEALAAGGDAAVHLNVVRSMGVPLVEIRTAAQAEEAVRNGGNADLIVDALLGTGAQGHVRGLARAMIVAVNALHRPVLAVDLPSGLDCDTGRALGVAVRCARTVTFVDRKTGFDHPGASEYTGEVRVADIGIGLERAPDAVLRGPHLP